MRVLVDGVEVFSEKYESWDQIMESYTEAETAQGRKVPAHAWEALALGVGGWILGKVGDGIISWYFGRKKKREEEERQRNLEAKLDVIASRQSELLDRLRSLEGLVNFAKENKASLQIELETGAERDLEEGLKELTKELPNVSIQASA